ncbi:hypothetical protein AK88_05502 [Plasmodium fragile]|uniref:Schizont-infected cell agglutination C-terminal domain-containing protein n=1 Tax=Plasmodium fragile TaxID=5857 RepID=A0A0D9QCT5_PLAFR|nr:uncharacterized protein AK88_05502 [Plasmodium fragile]KJP84865.1 hypothetical protein AK88_05502 [Plasmodium fragile]
MSYATLGALLANYVKTRGLVDNKEMYKKSLWNDITALLDEFAAYMDDEHLDSYAANCSNRGYTREGGGSTFFIANVGDRIMCTLMTGALYFLNGWGTQSGGSHTTDPNNAALKEYIRCAIVNIFMYILLASPCKSTMGIDNAWYTVKQMEESMGGLIKQGKCGHGVFENIQTQEFDMAKKIQAWLESNKSLTEKIGGQGIESICTKSLGELDRVTPGTHTMHDNTELREKEKEAIRKLGQQLKTIVEEVKTAVAQCAQENGACMEPIEAVSRSDPQDDASKAKVSNSVAGGKPAPDVPAGNPSAGSGVTDSGGARSLSQPQAPASPVLPAPAAGAKAKGAPGQGPGPAPAGPAPGQQPPPPQPPQSKDPAGKDERTPNNHKETETGEYTCPDDKPKNPHAAIESHVGSRVSITKGHYTPEGQASCEKIKELLRTQTSPATNSNPTHKKSEKKAADATTRQKPQDASQTPQGAPEPSSAGTVATTPVVDKSPETADPGATNTALDSGKATSTESQSPPGESGEAGPSGAVGDQGAKSDDRNNAVVDGGNDDTPPLNPSKPKPQAGNPQQNLQPTPAVPPISDCTGLRLFDTADPQCKNTQTSSSSGSGPDSSNASAGSPEGQSSSTPEDDYPFVFDNMLRTDAGSPGGGFVPLKPGIELPDRTNEHPGQNPDGSGPHAPDLTDTVLAATTPVLFFLSAVTVALLGYSLWKYFAYLAKRRRTYRTVRDVPSPPLDEEILEHLQRGEPPPDYGYKMVTQPASTSARRRRHPRVNHRTIIELHLEVLHECDEAEWENVKEDYWNIVVEEFAHDLEPDPNEYSSTSDPPTTNEGLPGTNVPSTESDGIDRCPPNEHDPDPCKCMENIQLATDTCASNDDNHDPWNCMDTIQLATDPSAPNEDDPDPWSCMETIQLATDPCRPNEEDRWNCMETIQFHAEQNAHSNPGDSTSDCIHWINWIDRNKHTLRACTTQPWFLQLKAHWNQYVRDHMVAHGTSGEHRTAATMDSKKHAWRQWVAQLHRQLSTYKAEQWFQHLLNNVEDQTVAQKAEVPREEQHLEVETVMGTEDVLRVTYVPRSQPLHQPPHMTKPLTANIWILILALVIEQCEVECRLHDRELYVDELLEQL